MIFFSIFISFSYISYAHENSKIHSSMNTISKNIRSINKNISKNPPELELNLPLAKEINYISKQLPIYFKNKPSKNEKTRLSPKIWTDSVLFSKEINNFQNKSNELLISLENGEINSIKSSFRELTYTCGSCHKKFRLKKD
tara:strand:- start:116 stop:538 length:423 start_codon:yes stop_codon:yes gene_type:complete